MQFFAEDGPLVELTYDSEGRPIALNRGKKRNRESDVAATFAWLRALKDQIKASPQEEERGEESEASQ